SLSALHTLPPRPVVSAAPGAQTTHAHIQALRTPLPSGSTPPPPAPAPPRSATTLLRSSSPRSPPSPPVSVHTSPAAGKPWLHQTMPCCIAGTSKCLQGLRSATKSDQPCLLHDQLQKAIHSTRSAGPLPPEGRCSSRKLPGTTGCMRYRDPSLVLKPV